MKSTASNVLTIEPTTETSSFVPELANNLQSTLLQPIPAYPFMGVARLERRAVTFFIPGDQQTHPDTKDNKNHLSAP